MAIPNGRSPSLRILLYSALTSSRILASSGPALAQACPSVNPNSEIAVATASSKKGVAPMRAPAAATDEAPGNTRRAREGGALGTQVRRRGPLRQRFLGGLGIEEPPQTAQKGSGGEGGAARGGRPVRREQDHRGSRARAGRCAALGPGAMVFPGGPA